MFETIFAQPNYIRCPITRRTSIKEEIVVYKDHYQTHIRMLPNPELPLIG